MKKVIGVALLLVVAVFLLPFLIHRGMEQEQAADPAAQEEIALPDSGYTLRILGSDGQVTEMDMNQYLWGVVAAEMPASFEEEALKAQACAARTYTVQRQNSPTQKHPQADVCTDSACCQAYVSREAAETRWGVSAQTYSEKIEAAVAGTDGLGILYEGQPIQAVFFSSAAGRTVDAVEVWGSDVAYLKSVSSPEGEEVPNYHSQGSVLRRPGAPGGAGRLPRPPTCRETLRAGSAPPPPTEGAPCPAIPWGASPSPGARCAPCSPCARPASPWPGTGATSPFPSPATAMGWA